MLTLSFLLCVYRPRYRLGRWNAGRVHYMGCELAGYCYVSMSSLFFFLVSLLSCFLSLPLPFCIGLSHYTVFPFMSRRCLATRLVTLLLHPITCHPSASQSLSFSNFQPRYSLTLFAAFPPSTYLLPFSAYHFSLPFFLSTQHGCSRRPRPLDGSGIPGHVE
jgi:hypothetical protein